MSGSWDRSSSGDPDDRWPSEDRATGDTWQEPAPEAPANWAAWPPPAPEEDLPDDAELPVSDPWAESWTADAPEHPATTAAEPSSPPELESWVPEAPARAEPWMTRDDEWSEQIATDPAPHPTRPPPEPEPEPEPEPGPELEPEPEPDPAPELEVPATESDLDIESQPQLHPALDPAGQSGPVWPDRGESTQVLPTTWAPAELAVADRSSGLDPVVGRIRVSLAQQAAAEAGAAAEAEAEAGADQRPSTAEQAVPWLIGVILLLAGMVIVLIALIFAGDASLGSTGGGAPSDSAIAVLSSSDPTATDNLSPAPSLAPSPSLAPLPSNSAVESAAPSAAPTPPPFPAPEYGALEVVYQGRSAALAPIYLLHRDFTVDEEAEIMAQDPTLDVRRYAWSADGTAGAGLLADVLVSIEPGKEKRRLADGISTITFGADGSTLYAVRVTPDGANDVATVLAIDFASGNTAELASTTYPRPTIGEEEALAEAQFTDEGGEVRLYWVEGGTLRFWALGAGTWQIEPDGGAMTALDADDRPTLWSPSADRRISIAFEDGMSTVALVDDADEPLETISLAGRVSHLRWAPDGERVIFTVGTSAAGGGILQDLYLWDLNPEDPTKLTATGAAFGAEWLGTQPVWRD